MGASTFATFDPAPLRLGTVIDFTATTAVLAGHVVGINATGVGWAVDKVTGPTAGTGGAPIGVALYSAAAGSKVAVACLGSVVKVMNATDGAIDAGDHLIAGATAGMVTVQATPATDSVEIGIALDDIAGSETGYMLITGPTYVPTGA